MLEGIGICSSLVQAFLPFEPQTGIRAADEVSVLYHGYSEARNRGGERVGRALLVVLVVIVVIVLAYMFLFRGRRRP
jgi:ABC-type sugar transport system permease subunit